MSTTKIDCTLDCRTCVWSKKIGDEGTGICAAVNTALVVKTISEELKNLGEKLQLLSQKEDSKNEKKILINPIVDAIDKDEEE